MDYKKKYEELLARLQEAKENVYKTDERYCCVIDSIVPELKESEEEKTKRMLDIITYKMSQHQPDIFTGEENEWLNDWLEKQGQTFTKKDVDDAYLKGVCDAKHELEKQGEKGINGNEREIPNSAWSEEDEKMIRGLIATCNEWAVSHSFYPLENSDMEEMKSWLKSLKDRVGCEVNCTTTKEWSEEDENIRQWIVSDIEKLLDLHKKASSIAVKEINWLKSLKDRVGCETNCTTTWKPSDEHYELEEFAKIVRCNLTGVSKAVQKLFEAKYLQLTGNKMYGGFKD